MTSDLIEALGLPWAYREESPKLARTGRAFIINLDDKEGKGTHWTAARLVDDTLYYADPFGTMLNGWPPEELQRIAHKKIVNRIAFQRPSTNLCGYYAILFARALDQIDRELGVEQLEALLYNSISL